MTKCGVSASLALLLSIAGCANWRWSEGAPREQLDPMTLEVEGDAEPETAVLTRSEDADLRLFGRDVRLEDVAFQGQAATNLRQHTTPSEGADFDPDIDPSGQLLVYGSTRHSNNSLLYLKSVNGATITQVTDGSADDTQPEFDPTGKRIAFSSNRSGHWDIWVVDIDGRNPIQVTASPMPELHPSWSPDGKKLVYCRVNAKEGFSELWVAELEKPGVKRLIGEGLFPAWSPKGDKIAYQRARARGSRWFSIWTLDIDDNEVLFPTEVASSPDGALIAPCWSPDGERLAFSLVRSGEAASEPTPGATPATETRVDIGVIDLDGRGFQRITNGRGRCYSPTWSRDGRVYFSARLARSETIWSVRPFRPTRFDESPSATTANNRRAAQIMDLEDEE